MSNRNRNPYHIIPGKDLFYIEVLHSSCFSERDCPHPLHRWNCHRFLTSPYLRLLAYKQLLTHGVLEGFEEKVKAFENGQVITDIHIDKSVTDRINKSTEQNKENIFNPATFRDFVLAGYGNACAVTGQSAESVLGEGIDVVYIRPKTAGGSCFPSNGIALTNKLSVAFVQGMFTLSDDYEVNVHAEVKDEELKGFHLKQIRVPPNPFFKPDLDSIHFHREHIYGSFRN